MSVHGCTTLPCPVCTTGTVSTAIAWNGPYCETCGAKYLGSHTCSHEDIVRRINELLALLKFTQPAPVYPLVRNPGPTDRTANCPCRRENGGSGVCGCVLSGPQVTC